MTQIVGLIGWPVEHSRSPRMHNAAFAALGLDWRYILLPTPPDQLDVVIGRLRSGELSGANVTIPHKQAVMPSGATADWSVCIAGTCRTMGSYVGAKADPVTLTTCP